MTEETSSSLSLRETFRRGVLFRCPQCGTGRIFQRYLKPVACCTTCGLVIEDNTGADAPSYFVMFFVIIVVPVLALMVEAAHSPPVWIHVMLWLPMTLGLSMLLLPLAKSIWIGLEYKNRTGGFKTQTQHKK